MTTKTIRTCDICGKVIAEVRYPPPTNFGTFSHNIRIGGKLLDCCDEHWEELKDAIDGMRNKNGQNPLWPPPIQHVEVL